MRLSASNLASNMPDSETAAPNVKDTGYAYKGCPVVINMEDGEMLCWSVGGTLTRLPSDIEDLFVDLMLLETMGSRLTAAPKEIN